MDSRHEDERMVELIGLSSYCFARGIGALHHESCNLASPALSGAGLPWPNDGHRIKTGFPRPRPVANKKVTA